MAPGGCDAPFQLLPLCPGGSVVNSSMQFLKASRSLVEGFSPLAESEADLLCAIYRMAIEARAGDSGNADFAHEVLCEGDVVRKTEAADVSHHVVCAARHKTLEAGFVQRAEQAVTALAVSLSEIAVVAF